MDNVTCPYVQCKNKFDADSVKKEFEKYGKSCICPKCGRKIMLTKRATLSKPMPRMSKKDRRKARSIVISAIEKKKKDDILLEVAQSPMADIILDNLSKNTK